MFVTWLSTVRSEMKSCAAVSAFVAPSAMSRATSISRRERPPWAFEAATVHSLRLGFGPQCVRDDLLTLHPARPSNASAYCASPSAALRGLHRTLLVSQERLVLLARGRAPDPVGASEQGRRTHVIAVGARCECENLRQVGDPGTSPSSWRISRPEAREPYRLVEVAATQGSDRQEVERVGANGLLAESLAEGDRFQAGRGPALEIAPEDLRDPLYVHRRQDDEVESHHPAEGHRLVGAENRLVLAARRPSSPQRER